MAELSIKGKVVKVLPELSGTSTAGKTWIKQDFVIEEIDGSFLNNVLIFFISFRFNGYLIYLFLYFC